MRRCQRNTIGKITIGRLRRDRGISVARPTALGNPFAVGPYAREDAIALYRTWFAEQIAARSPKVMVQLERIVAAARAGDVTLLCHCAPKACHANVIAQWVRETIDRKSEHSPSR